MNQAGQLVGSVLHVGTNKGQEPHEHEANSATPRLYVEPLDGAFLALRYSRAGIPFTE